MSVDESLMCSFQILKPGEKKPPNSSNNRKVMIFSNFTIKIFNLVRELRNSLIGQWNFRFKKKI